MSDTVYEPERDVRVVEDADVVVCGAGPAGTAAAIAAGRAGARVVLIELTGSLGGIWTSGLLSYVLDSGNKGGLLTELTAQLEAKAGKRATGDHGAESPERDLPWVTGSFLYDTEVMKLTLEELCRASGVRVRLHTRVVGAVVQDERVEAAITESVSGREAWKARVFIDATGNGDLAAVSGCGFDIGHPRTGSTQPMTLMALVSGIRFDEIARFVSLHQRGNRPAKELLYDQICSGGFTPSYSSPTLFAVRDDLFAFMANHVYDAQGIDADAVSEATFRARSELFRVRDALRASGPEWRGLQIVQTAEHIGVREARRIHGRYTVTQDDLIAGLRHDDAVCTVTFPVDIHVAGPAGRGYDNGGVRSKPYDIPLRALMSRDRTNLLMAGRCISGDYWAHASYRVTGDAVPMGEAAGVLAAASVKAGCAPHLAAHRL
jgi:hypothetical protein